MIGLFGATGYTGKLIARELKRLNLPFFIAGRSKEKLAALAAELGVKIETVQAGVDDAASLQKMCGECKVLINCVGPFGLYGEPVIKACVDAGIHYVDTTGEALFIRAMKEKFHDAAQKKNIAVSPALAFETALSNFGVALASGNLKKPLDVTLAYYTASFGASGTSAGTKRSALRFMSYAAGTFTAARRAFHFPKPAGKQMTLSFPAGDVASAEQFLNDPSSSVKCFMSVPMGTAIFGPYLLPTLRILQNKAVAKFVDKMISKGEEGPSDDVRKKGAFFIMVEAKEKNSSSSKKLLIEGVSPYDITAVIAAHGAERLLNDKPKNVGVHPAAAVFNVNEFMKYLEKHDVRVSVY